MKGKPNEAVPDSATHTAQASVGAKVFTVDRITGRLTQAQWLPSDNFSPKDDPDDVQLIVIHNISLPPAQFGGQYIADFFQNKLDCDAHPYFDEHLRHLKVSSHFLIRRDGDVMQFVSLFDQAWHAGQSSFNGREACNAFSIGIELEGTDDLPYEAAQYTCLTHLINAIEQHCGRTLSITGHQHIAPQRKTDPGKAFDWKSLGVTLARDLPDAS